MEGRVKVRDGAVVVGPFEVDAQGGTVRGKAQLALEAGNSPDIIFRNYLELVTQTQARNWFGIEPEAKGNVISINSGA